MLSWVFTQCLAELYVASEFGVPIDINAAPGDMLGWGVKARPTLRLGFSANRPILQEPYTYSLSTDHAFAHVCVVIEVGADPLSVIIPGAQPADLDRMAYQPYRLFCAGWTLAPWVYGQDIKWPEQFGWGLRPPAAFTALCDDLFAPQALPLYLDAACSADVGCGLSHQPLDNWKDELVGLISMCPTLPCEWCLLFNRQIENGIRMAPRKWGLKTADPDELTAYKKKLKGAVRAAVSANGRFDSNYRKLRSYRRRCHRELRKKRREDARECKRNSYGFWR
jgi:hypothetical protein